MLWHLFIISLMDTTKEQDAERLSPNEVLVRLTESVEGGQFPDLALPEILYTFFRAATSFTGLGYETYGSTSLTSGGAMRLEQYEQLSFAEKFNYNVRMAEVLVQAVMANSPEELASSGYINPGMLGKIPHYHFEAYGTRREVDAFWGQDDFLRFWFAVIVKLEPVSGEDEERWNNLYLITRKLFTGHAALCEQESSIMNDPSASEEDRIAAYYSFTDTFVGCVRYMQEQGVLDLSPVGRLVGLVDPGRSFGGRAEEEFALALDIETLKVVLSGGGDVAQYAAEVVDGQNSTPTPDDIELESSRRPSRDVAFGSGRADAFEGAFDTQVQSELEEFLRSMRACITGPTEEAEQLARLMAVDAYRFTHDKRELFHPVVIREVLFPGVQTLAQDQSTNLAAAAFRKVRSMRQSDLFDR